MDIHQLELFLAVLDSPSMTRAAEKVFLSPGAISLQLHNLADELQTELFVRNGKRLVPTLAALRLAGHARAMMSLTSQIRHEFQNDVMQDTHPFHFATGVTTLIYQLGEPLRQMRKQFPNAEIQVHVCATEETLAGVRDRHLDLGLITMVSEENLKDLKVVRLFDEELLIAQPMATHFRERRVFPIRASDLEGVPLLTYPKGTVLRVLIERFFREINVIPRIAMEADDTEAIKHLVEAGFGYSILPAHALRQQTGYFKSCRLEQHPILRSLALVMVKTDYPRTLTASIAEFLLKHLAT